MILLLREKTSHSHVNCVMMIVAICKLYHSYPAYSAALQELAEVPIVF